MSGEAMKMKITRLQEWNSLACAIKRISEIDASPSHSSRYDTKLSFHEYMAQISESIGAEYAVARYLGYEDFNPLDSKFKATADVGAIFEVKWTKYDAGSLIIYDSDRNCDIAILVTGRSPNYVIKGWIPVAVAKDKRWRRVDQPTYWVEQYNLHPIENLRRSSYGETTLQMQN